MGRDSLIGDDLWLYWWVGPIVFRAPKIGGPATVVVDLRSVSPTRYAPPKHVAVERDAVVVVTSGGDAEPDEIWRIPTDGTAPSYVAHDMAISDIVSDGVDIYWATWDCAVCPSGVIYAANRGGAVVPVASPSTYVYALAVNATCLYWLEMNGTVLTISKTRAGNDLPMRLH